MRHGWRAAIGTIVCLAALAVAAQAAHAALFYGVQSGSLGRIDLDGANQVDGLISTPPGTRDVVASATHLYWTHPGGVGRARLDGSEATQTFVSAPGDLRGMAIDATHVYWTDEVAGTISRASLADGTVDGTWSIATPDVTDVAVDGTYVYWSDNLSGAIGRALKADPSTAADITGNVGAFESILVHSSHLYYAGGLTIGRSALDGTGAAAFVAAANWPHGLATDGQYLYFVEFGATLKRVNLADGTGSTTLATLPATAWGVAVGPEVGRMTLGAAPTFPDTVAGATSAAQTVTVTNSGEAALTVDAVTLTGADAAAFSIDGETCTGGPLAVGASCDVDVVFAPGSAGAKAAALEVSSSDADASPKTRALSATALAPPAVTFGAAPTFPDQVVGTTGPTRTVTVTDSGGSPLTVSGVSLVGADAGEFELVSEDCTAGPVAASGTCEAVVRFAPGSAGAKAAGLRVTSDAASSPDELALAGTALALPAVSFGAAPTFPDQVVGTAGPTRTVTVTNPGGSPLTVSGVSLTGADAGSFQLVSEDCTAGPVAVAGTCEAVVRLAPGSPGAKAAALRIASDAPSSPDDLALAGVAVAVAWPAPELGSISPSNAPELGTLTPSRGPDGAVVVTIEGSWLTGISRVLFGDVEAERFEVLGFTRLLVTVPVGVPGSVVRVRVVGPGGTSNALTFAYDPAPAPPAPLAPVAAPSCVVPDLERRTRRGARRALKRAGCRLGEVIRPNGTRARRLRVVSQSAAAGTQLAHGAPVDVGLGRRSA